MSAIIKFDPLSIGDDLTFVLANRNGHKLGVVPAYNVNFKNCCNTYSEVSFRISKYDNGVECDIWKQVKDFKTIWCKEWDLWFEISVEIDENDDNVKNVLGKTLCESELSQINLYNIEINTEADIARDDYSLPTVFYRPDRDYKDSSLLDRLMEKTPHYSIVHVDASLCDIQKTFDFNDISIYDAFQTISDEVGCLFQFDSSSDENGIVKREISVYDLYSNCYDCGYRGDFVNVCPKCGSHNIQSGYGNDTGIFVSVDNLADEIVYSTDTDSVKNCFKLVAGDDLMNATIRNCNPNGTDYIWYISDSVKSDMSVELSTKINEYNDLYSFYQNDNTVNIPSTLRTNVNSLINKYHDFIPEMNQIPSSVVGFPNLMNLYYDTIDMKLFLTSNLMPTIDTDTDSIDAQSEFEKLTRSSLSPVSTMSPLSSLSETVASNAVLSYAKTFVHPNYQVSLNRTTVDGTSYPYLETSGNQKIWHGIFYVKNKYDDEDFYTNTNSAWRIAIDMTNDADIYYIQKVSKMLGEKSKNNIDIVDIFSNDYDDFCDILTEYGLDSLNGFYDACQSVLDILMEQGASRKDSDYYDSLYLPYYNKLNAIQDEITIREQEIQYINDLQNYIVAQRNSIQDDLNFEDYLGDTLWQEFCSYRRDETYSNSNYISDGLDNAELFQKALEFIEVATSEIYKSAELQHSISGNLKNLLAMDEFKNLTDNFEVGNWLHIRVDSDVYKLRLLSYEIDYDNLENINVEFSDVMKVIGGISDVKSVLDQAASMATSYDYVARQAKHGSDGNKRINNWVEKGLALTNTFISNADNQEVILDNHGLLMREFFPITETYNDKQLKIINKGLYVTDDNWESSRAGIGNFIYYDPIDKVNKEAYGVIADTLIGNLILGENVGIYTTTNDITLNESGFIITNENKAGITNPITITMNPNNKNGLFVIESEDNGDILKVKSSGELIIGNNRDFVVSANGDINCKNIDLGAGCYMRGGYIIGCKLVAVDSTTSTTGIARIEIDDDGIVGYNSSNQMHGFVSHPASVNYNHGFSVYRNGDLLLDASVYGNNFNLSFYDGTGDACGQITANANDNTMHFNGNWDFPATTAVFG